MKYLIMCEGPNELEVVKLLLENDCFIFTMDKAKTFAKENIKCGRKAYKNDTAFYRDYYGNNIPLLVNSIKQYRQHQGAHKKDEHYLAELLNKKNVYAAK